jgi:hypothetical protein
MNNNNWIKVGEIGVDAGLCWVGDPCYIMGQDASSHPCKTWNEFCDILRNKELENENTPRELTAQWQFPLGHDMAKKAWLAGNPLAHDLLHEIENFDYENPDAQLFIRKHEHTAPVNV